MLESLLAYINAHTWAQAAFVAVLFAPPVLISAADGARGLSALAVMAGWWSLLLIMALLMV
ncbi:MAG: hypothetical protein ACPL3S_01675 [Halothiobacillaceae bacterium]